MTGNPEKPPFEAHRRYYLLLKVSIAVVLVLVALRYLLNLPIAP
jgi:hypothetical protein